MELALLHWNMCVSGADWMDEAVIMFVTGLRAEIHCTFEKLSIIQNALMNQSIMTARWCALAVLTRRQRRQIEGPRAVPAHIVGGDQNDAGSW